ncbi:MAG: hypothetical protein JETCAE03_33680 [Ignavibacteriaceae bacterium]|jgi:hypothetical protein|nr:MAG: hypothetical protein JETCAE03_33680 [Ignavibacteriaceae bacterium]
MKPLIKPADYLPFIIAPKLIQESLTKNSGRLIVSGVLQRANAKNQNGRIYPRAILDRELKKYQNLIKERRSMGELDHPDSAIVNLQNVSHIILDAKWDGDDIIGTIEVLNTPSGKILKELFLADVRLGISSRGLGSVSELDEGTLQVEDDFELVGWDFVSNPSTHGAFMSPQQLTESVSKNPVVACRNKIECLIRDILIELGN